MGLSTAAASCLAPLGMESGDIKDDRISSSSSFEPKSVGSERGRLNHDHGGGAWCPKNFVSQDSSEFLEIDLIEEHTVSGVITQGRFANGQGQEFTEYFLIEYWRPGMEKFAEYTEENGNRILKGNSDTFSESRVLLNPPVVASKVRIVPFSEHIRTVCMRVELLGCVAPVSPIPLQSSERSRYLGILTGVLLTLSALLLAVVLLLVRRRGLKKYPSLSSVSISGSFLERQPGAGDEPEPVYQEPGLHFISPTLSMEYSTPISVIYSRPLSIYEVYQSPEHLRDSSTDISYLEESSVDSSSSSNTPRLPPIPNFDDDSYCFSATYVNQDELRTFENKC